MNNHHIRHQLRRYPILILLLLTLHTAFTSSQVFADAWNLTLKDVLTSALKENSIITIHRLGEDISKERVKFESSIFIPDVAAGANNYNYHWNDFTIDNYSDKGSYEYYMSLRGKQTDGSELSLNMSTKKENYSYMIPQYDIGQFTSGLYLKYYLPLLRGYGKEVTAVGIDKAKIDLDTSRERYEFTKSDVLFNVLKAYYELYRIRQQIRISREIFRNTEKIYEIVKEKVDKRKMPITEQLKMEVALKTQEQFIIGLENDEKKKTQLLMLAIYNVPDKEGDRTIELLTTPEYMIPVMALPPPEEMISRIEKVDMTLISLNNDMKLQGRDLVKALNEIKPDLNLNTEVGMSGYDLNDWNTSLSNFSSNNYRVNIGLELKFPLTNTRFRSRINEITDLMKQTKIKAENRKSEIRKIAYELRNDVTTVSEQIKIYRKVVALAEENLKNETERLIRGKTTVLYTLDYQSDLSNARFQLIRFKIDELLLLGTYSLYARQMEDLIKLL